MEDRGGQQSSRKQPVDFERVLKSRLKDYPGLSKISRSDPFGPNDNIVTRPQNLATPDHQNGSDQRNSLDRRRGDQTGSITPGSGGGLLGNEVVSETRDPNYDPHNDMDKYLKPSEYLKYNLVPPMEECFLLDYNLSLDIRNDGISVDNHTPEYAFKFSQFGNISRVELVSIIVSHHSILEEEPYLFINFKELQGRCHLSNGTRTFGKIMLTNTQGNHLIYLPEECFQSYSQPISLDTLTVSFCDASGIPINIREIKVNRVLRLKSTPELIIECNKPHYLKEGEKIEVQIIKTIEIESYEVDVISVTDETTFRIKNDFQDLTKHIRIFKTKINLSFTLKFSEINWFLLNDNSITSSQIIKLSELVRERTRKALETENQ